MNERPVQTYHRMIEAFNFAAAKVTYLTDPAFSNKTNEVSRQEMEVCSIQLVFCFTRRKKMEEGYM